MRKQRTTTIITNFRWGTFAFILLFLGIQIIPHTLGQRGQQKISQRTSYAPSRMDGGAWTVTGSLNTGRFLHTATLLPNGMVLVAGGLDGSFHATPSAEPYDPVGGTWTATGNLNTERYEHTATLLPDGKVLVCPPRPVLRLPVRVQAPVAESYSSALAEAFPLLSNPPATSTIPLDSNIAVCP